MRSALYGGKSVEKKKVQQITQYRIRERPFNVKKNDQKERRNEKYEEKAFDNALSRIFRRKNHTRTEVKL